MLTPSLLSVVTPFYAVGNTPAVSLTRCLPQGVDADILLLGCGDVRHILYTAYSEKGLPTRKLDLTCCDVEDAIIARNVLVLTLLVSQPETARPQLLWNLYYHLFLDDESVQVLQAHVDKLVSLSASLKEWKDSEFGAKFRFVDEATLKSVRHLWTKYSEAVRTKDTDQYRATFAAALKKSKDYKDSAYDRRGLVYGGVRAAAPLGMQTMAGAELGAALDTWWETGMTGIMPGNHNVPNPLFAVTLSDNSVLSHGGDPILSYHLATAQAHLAEVSPLRTPESGKTGQKTPDIVETARFQFSEWTKAFLQMESGDLVIRFLAADGFAFCHTLQHNIATGETSDHFYRRQLSTERLDLEASEYSVEGSAPRRFDVIDTSNLSDFFGALNILISASPLLKDTPWATLYTETMEKGTDGEKQKFEELLCGQTRTVSTLLGISPAEYWTNATAVSNVDEYMLAVAATETSSQKPGIQWRFAWKFNEHLSGQPDRLRLVAKDDALANLVHKVYQAMFANEDIMAMMRLSKQQQQNMVRKHAYPKYSRGSLVAFMKRLLQRVDANVESVSRQVLQKIMSDSTRVFGSNFGQSLDLEISRQGLYTEPWLGGEIRRGPSSGVFSTWSEIPEAMAVTISIPPASWKKIYKLALKEGVGFAVHGNMWCVEAGVEKWRNYFADVQVSFGTANTSGTQGSDDFAVVIEEDKRLWSGDSPMVATFYVPTAALQVDPKHTKVALCLQHSPQNLSIFNAKLQLGPNLVIYETDLEDGAHVYITKNQPGQDGFPIYNNLTPEAAQTLEATDHHSSFVANLDLSGAVNTITGHLDVLSTEGKKLLADKASVDVRKISPFVFEVVLGKRDAVYTLHFPVPVVKDGSKTRIARTSSYIEIIAPLADPATAQSLDDFIYPSTLVRPDPAASVGQAIPVTLNISHLNLDSLPILDVSDKQRLSFLTTLASWTFSVRERKLREQNVESNESGLATSARMNFKESLFTMFMLASGLQGGQTGLFAINHPQKGGIHMLIFISALRLDGANASVVLDAAVIPFAVDTIKEGKLDSFLLILRTLECCTITVDDEELVLWKKVLPALVERCRNWAHGRECEYNKADTSIPLSVEMGQQVICSCGAGKLPDSFTSLPEWDNAAKFATRFAISPTYAVPFVEEVIDPEMAKNLTKDGGSGMGVMGDETLRCWNCGKMEAKGGGPLKRCVQCLKAKYCSAECQKKDWKKHRMECKEVEKRSK